jgi:hypothetical protein
MRKHWTSLAFALVLAAAMWGYFYGVMPLGERTEAPPAPALHGNNSDLYPRWLGGPPGPAKAAPAWQNSSPWSSPAEAARMPGRRSGTRARRDRAPATPASEVIGAKQMWVKFAIGV